MLKPLRDRTYIRFIVCHCDRLVPPWLAKARASRRAFLETVEQPCLRLCSLAAPLGKAPLTVLATAWLTLDACSGRTGQSLDAVVAMWTSAAAVGDSRAAAKPSARASDAVRPHSRAHGPCLRRLHRWAVWGRSHRCDPLFSRLRSRHR